MSSRSSPTKDRPASSAAVRKPSSSIPTTPSSSSSIGRSRSITPRATARTPRSLSSSSSSHSSVVQSSNHYNNYGESNAATVPLSNQSRMSQIRSFNPSADDKVLRDIVEELLQNNADLLQAQPQSQPQSRPSHVSQGDDDFLKRLSASIDGNRLAELLASSSSALLSSRSSSSSNPIPTVPPQASFSSSLPSPPPSNRPSIEHQQLQSQSPPHQPSISVPTIPIPSPPSSHYPNQNGVQRRIQDDLLPSNRVRVTVRMRPAGPHDLSTCRQISVSSIENVVTIGAEAVDRDRRFFFDHVLGPSATQSHVYKVVAYDLIEDILRGINGCVMAYGVTGAGKTYTLSEINGDHSGIVPRTVQHLFDRIDADTKRYTYNVTVSYFQIYMEQVLDLLKPENAALQIREDPRGISPSNSSNSSNTNGGGVYVAGLSEHHVRHLGDVFSLLEQGSKHKAVAQTRMNRQSSRSHCLFVLNVERRIRRNPGEALPVDSSNPPQVLRSRFTAVDLAGSERASKTQAEGLLFEEAKRINLSLSALGNVIAALAEGRSSKFIPWRDSKLTRLLQNTVGGNANTSLIVNIGPDDSSLQETVTSLLFGQRAMKVKVAPSVNMELDYKALAVSLQARLDSIHDRQAKSREEVDMEFAGMRSENEALYRQLDNMRRLYLEAVADRDATAVSAREIASKSADMQQRLREEVERARTLEEILNIIDDQRKEAQLLQNSITAPSPSRPSGLGLNSSSSPFQGNRSSAMSAPFDGGDARSSLLSASAPSPAPSSSPSILAPSSSSSSLLLLDPNNNSGSNSNSNSLPRDEYVLALREQILEKESSLDILRRENETLRQANVDLRSQVTILDGNTAMLDETVAILASDAERKAIAAQSLRSKLNEATEWFTKCGAQVQSLHRIVAVLQKNHVVDIIPSVLSLEEQAGIPVFNLDDNMQQDEEEEKRSHEGEGDRKEDPQQSVSGPGSPASLSAVNSHQGVSFSAPRTWSILRATSCTLANLITALVAREGSLYSSSRALRTLVNALELDSSSGSSSSTSTLASALSSAAAAAAAASDPEPVSTPEKSSSSHTHTSRNWQSILFELRSEVDDDEIFRLSIESLPPFSSLNDIQLVQSLNRARDLAARASSENMESQQLVQELRHQLSNTQRSLQEAEVRVKQLNQTENALKSELERNKEEMADLRRSDVRKSHELESLQEKVSVLEERLEESRRSHDQAVTERDRAIYVTQELEQITKFLEQQHAELQRKYAAAAAAAEPAAPPPPPAPVTPISSSSSSPSPASSSSPFSDRSSSAVAIQEAMTSSLRYQQQLLQMQMQIAAGLSPTPISASPPGTTPTFTPLPAAPPVPAVSSQSHSLLLHQTPSAARSPLPFPPAERNSQSPERAALSAMMDNFRQFVASRRSENSSQSSSSSSSSSAPVAATIPVVAAPSQSTPRSAAQPTPLSSAQPSSLSSSSSPFDSLWSSSASSSSSSSHHSAPISSSSSSSVSHNISLSRSNSFEPNIMSSSRGASAIPLVSPATPSLLPSSFSSSSSSRISSMEESLSQRMNALHSQQQQQQSRNSKQNQSMATPAAHSKPLPQQPQEPKQTPSSSSSSFLDESDLPSSSAAREAIAARARAIEQLEMERNATRSRYEDSSRRVAEMMQKDPSSAHHSSARSYNNMF